jgi:glycine betaine/choline ABC-type transport system substrate-binding protein
LRQFEAIVAAILAPLDNNKMAELNKQVSIDDEEPSAVANSFLVERGIITN